MRDAVIFTIVIGFLTGYGGWAALFANSFLSYWIKRDGDKLRIGGTLYSEMSHDWAILKTRLIGMFFILIDVFLIYMLIFGRPPSLQN
jgi:hypothetical protein